MMGVKRLIVPVLLTLILAASLTSTVQATKPLLKEVDTAIIDGPFGDSPEAYAKGVLHGTLIAKPVGEGLAKVSMTMIQKFNFYELIDSEAGEFLGTAKVTGTYTGIVTVEGEEISGFWTGTAILDWRVNADIVLPEGTDYAGHWVIRYEEGSIIKENKKGVPPFPSPFPV